MIEQKILKELKTYVNEEKRLHYPKFFKTGKGEYGEGDKFLGVVVPDLRTVAKKYSDLSFSDLRKLIGNEYHEIRFFALVILTDRFKKSKSEKERKEIFDFYLSHTEHINNWDLVDVSARDIVGGHLLDKDRDILYELSESESLWEQRIAMVATYALIHNDDFEDTLKLAEIYLTHEHDLMHKASGWMLREMGKRDEAVLCGFLDKFHKVMPRTMLRYSIERLTPEERKHYMAK